MNLLLKIIIFILISFTNAYACKCAILSDCGALKNSTIAFVGKVKSISETKENSMSVDVTFSIEKMLKGTSASLTIILKAMHSGWNCSVRFQKGKKYLVYQTNSEIITFCNGSREYE